MWYLFSIGGLTPGMTSNLRRALPIGDTPSIHSALLIAGLQKIHFGKAPNKIFCFSTGNGKPAERSINISEVIALVELISQTNSNFVVAPPIFRAPDNNQANTAYCLKAFVAQDIRD